MTTTTKNIFRNQVREYVLNNIDFSSITELVETCKQETYSPRPESGFSKMINWLQGLPTNVYFAFDNDEQREVASQWFENCGDSLDERFTSDDFYYWITKEIAYLFSQENEIIFTLYMIK